MNGIDQLGHLHIDLSSIFFYILFLLLSFSGNMMDILDYLIRRQEGMFCNFLLHIWHCTVVRYFSLYKNA